MFENKLHQREVLSTLTKTDEPTYYYLFGERLKAEDLKKFDKVAQKGDFAVVRIPRILRYPVKRQCQEPLCGCSMRIS